MTELLYVIEMLAFYFMVSVFFRLNSKFAVIGCILIAWTVTGLAIFDHYSLANEVGEIMYYFLLMTVALVALENMRPGNRI